MILIYDRNEVSKFFYIMIYDIACYNFVFSFVLRKSFTKCIPYTSYVL